MDFQFDTTADGHHHREDVERDRRVHPRSTRDRRGSPDRHRRRRRCLGSPGPQRTRARALRSSSTSAPSSWRTPWSDWCRFNGAGPLFIDSGSPWQNAWIESFNGRLRDELLNSWRFDSLLEARVIIEDWRCDYNANTTPLRPRRTHPIRVRPTVDHDPPTPSRIATGPPNGSPS